MRILRISVSALFIIVLIMFCIFKIQQLNADNTYPVISIEESILDVSIHASENDLMAGVTAYDEKDGDITDRIILESISSFTEPGICIVKYAVCDADNHAASAERKIRYTDYTSPRFTLSEPLVFGISQNINIRGILGAVDSIDGDISDKVIISANEYSSNIASVNYISAKVTNSKWEMISIQLPVYIENRSLSAPEIRLTDYLLYLKTGDTLNIEETIISALDASGRNLKSQVTVDTNLNLNQPGLYEVHYRVSDSAGREGHSILFVIVED